MLTTKNAPHSHIKTWQKFAREVRSKDGNLLRRLGEFPDSVLITGCQRSGTTMLSRVITESAGMVKYWFGPDDELDAALILSGNVDYKPEGRYCFQTTYLNERYREYFDHHDSFKMIWVLRNPYSVVYSFLYNWERFALNELFRDCATHLLDGKERRRYDLFGRWGISRLKRACLAYSGKVSQVFEIRKKLGESRVIVVDYDKLVTQPDRLLPKIYEFIDLPYKPEYSNKIHSMSVRKGDQLSGREGALVEEICIPVYDKAKSLVVD